MDYRENWKYGEAFVEKPRDTTEQSEVGGSIAVEQSGVIVCYSGTEAEADRAKVVPEPDNSSFRAQLPA